MAEDKREVVLRLSDITMQFGGVVAVDNLNLDVHKNEIVGLIDREEFTADPMGAYANKIYCKAAPMKTAVIWNKDFIDIDR